MHRQYQPDNFVVGLSKKTLLFYKGIKTLTQKPVINNVTNFIL